MEKDANWLLKEKYKGQKTPEYFRDVERLKAGEPLAYLIGHIPFLNCTIHLDSKPLIPRPETEFWVECFINELKRRQLSIDHPPQRPYSERGLDEIETAAAFDYQNHQQLQDLETESLGRECKDFAPARLNVLDLCAGSGCIGVAAAKAIPEAHITFGEIDPLHAQTILKNCIANDIGEERFTIATSDLFENISGQFDFILSNPPYIDPTVDRAESSVKAYEPHLALYGGRGGVELIEKIIAVAPAHLTPGGQLWLEHEPEQVGFISACGSMNGFKTITHNDQYEIARYSILEKTL